jgi:hypothetical protein
MRAAAVVTPELSNNYFRYFKRSNPEEAAPGTYATHFINNSSTEYFRLRPDLSTEGTETITFTLRSRGISPTNTTTVTVADTSINPVDQPLRLLHVARNSTILYPGTFPFPPRSVDINEGFSTKSYVYPPDYTKTDLSNTIGAPIYRNSYSGAPLTLGPPYNQNSDYFDSIIDPSRTFTRYTGKGITSTSNIPYSETQSSDKYDIIIFNQFGWLSHTNYTLRQTDDNGNRISPNVYGFKARKPPGLMRPDATTMNLLKAFVTNGGTIIDCCEHFNYGDYVWPWSSSSGRSETGFDWIPQIIYDLGGINGANNSWKGRTRIGTGYMSPSTWASNNLSGSLTDQQRGYGATIVNSRSNGEAIIEYDINPSQSVVHIWDGNLGHLNNGVKGKIIFLGDSQLQGYTGSSQSNYKNGLVTPLLRYISENRVT